MSAGWLQDLLSSLVRLLAIVALIVAIILIIIGLTMAGAVEIPLYFMVAKISTAFMAYMLAFIFLMVSIWLDPSVFANFAAGLAVVLRGVVGVLSNAAAPLFDGLGPLLFGLGAVFLITRKE